MNHFSYNLTIVQINILVFLTTEWPPWDFVSVQVKHIVQKGHFSLMQERIKMSHINKMAYQ